MSKLYEGFLEEAPDVVLKRFRTRKEAEAWTRNVSWLSRRRMDPRRRAFRKVDPGCGHVDCAEHPELRASCREWQRIEKQRLSRPEKKR